MATTPPSSLSPPSPVVHNHQPDQSKGADKEETNPDPIHTQAESQEEEEEEEVDEERKEACRLNAVDPNSASLQRRLRSKRKKRRSVGGLRCLLRSAMVLGLLGAMGGGCFTVYHLMEQRVNCLEAELAGLRRQKQDGKKNGECSGGKEEEEEEEEKRDILLRRVEAAEDFGRKATKRLEEKIRALELVLEESQDAAVVRVLEANSQLEQRLGRVESEARSMKREIQDVMGEAGAGGGSPDQEEALAELRKSVADAKRAVVFLGKRLEETGRRGGAAAPGGSRAISFGAVKSEETREGPVSSFAAVVYGSSDGAFSADEGTFTAPAAGVYLFSYSGMCSLNVTLSFVTNDDSGSSPGVWHNYGGRFYESCSHSHASRLSAGDRVRLRVTCERGDVCLYGRDSFFFFGERIADKL